MPVSLSVVAAVLMLSTAHQPTPPQNPNARVITSPAALIFNLIKPDKTVDFELIMRRVHDALAKSSDPLRQKQAAGWKAYKAAEEHKGSILYLIVIDPAVPGADYSISRILAEAYPAEVQDLYVKFRDAYTSGQTLWNLTPIAGEGTPAKQDP
jgi:hypothetical protein